MAVVSNMQVDRDEELGLTIWTDTTSQSVSIGLEESWYVRSIVSLPVDLSGRELNEQICEELHMQFPTQGVDWIFDYVTLNGAPPLDGLQVWELFALASKHMVAIRKLCSEKQWRLVCVAPHATLAQAQLGVGACFYPTRQHRQSLLWRKRCIKGGLGFCAGLILFLGMGSGYSLASAYWADSHQQTKEDIAEALSAEENHPSPALWMLQEFERTKEPLEFYNLQDLRLVGFIQQGRSTSALIHVNGQPQLGIHSVRLGAYLGKNYGRVSQITQDAVLLLELHQDSSGVWIEQETSLQMATQDS